jgi:hypothetical protein
MKLTQLLKTKLLPVTAGAVVVALAAGGVAYATTPSAPTTPSASAASSSALRLRHPVIRRDVIWLVHHSVHAQLIVSTKNGYRTVDIDKGRLVSDSSTTITIVRPDGPQVSATVTSSTKFFGLKESQLSRGDGVILVSSNGDALYVASRRPLSLSPSASASTSTSSSASP